MLHFSCDGAALLSATHWSRRERKEYKGGFSQVIAGTWEEQGMWGSGEPIPDLTLLSHTTSVGSRSCIDNPGSQADDLRSFSALTF